MENFKKITSYVFMITLILLAFLLTFSFLLKWNLRESEISTYLKANDLSFVLKNVDGTENKLIIETKNVLDKIGIPEETIEEVLNSDATKKFISKYITDILQYLIYDQNKSIITSTDIKKLASENTEIIEKALSAQGLTFTEEQKKKINDLIDKYVDEVMTFFPTAQVLLSKLDQKEISIYNNITLEQGTDFIRLLTSQKWMITILIMMICSGGLIICCNFKKRKTWYYLKLATFTYGFTFILIEVLLGTVIKEQLMLKIISAKDFINYMINTLSKNLWGFIVISLVLSLIFARLQRGKKNNTPILDRLYSTDEKDIKEIELEK